MHGCPPVIGIGHQRFIILSFTGKIHYIPLWPAIHRIINDTISCIKTHLSAQRIPERNVH